jgi:hypothetical protein
MPHRGRREAGVRFELNCAADRDGRLEGTLAWEDGGGPVPFSGALELLRLLEDHIPRRRAAENQAAPGAGGEP